MPAAGISNKYRNKWRSNIKQNKELKNERFIYLFIYLETVSIIGDLNNKYFKITDEFRINLFFEHTTKQIDVIMLIIIK